MSACVLYDVVFYGVWSADVKCGECPESAELCRPLLNSLVLSVGFSRCLSAWNYARNLGAYGRTFLEFREKRTGWNISSFWYSSAKDLNFELKRHAVVNGRLCRQRLNAETHCSMENRTLHQQWHLVSTDEISPMLQNMGNIFMGTSVMIRAEQSVCFMSVGVTGQ